MEGVPGEEFRTVSRGHVSWVEGEDGGRSGVWQASFMILASPLIKNPEQSADEDAEKNEEDSEGEGWGPPLRRVSSAQGFSWHACLVALRLAPHRSDSLLCPSRPQALRMRMRMRMESALQLS